MVVGEEEGEEVLVGTVTYSKEKHEEKEGKAEMGSSGRMALTA